MAFLSLSMMCQVLTLESLRQLLRGLHRGGTAQQAAELLASGYHLMPSDAFRTGGGMLHNLSDDSVHFYTYPFGKLLYFGLP